ncbi:MAG: RNA polymerase sigma factor [Clostridia bacterium]|nr:RNA polymerase sigma factor [Clostridia bacterium]
MSEPMQSYDRFLSGDNSGISELIETYRDGLILYINGYVKNLDTAEDIAEDVFVKMIIKRPEFRGESSFKTWLYSIARNLALDRMRRAKRLKTETADETLIYGNHTDAETEYIRNERKAIIHRALDRINPDYRQIIYLSYFERFTNSEISVILKKSKRQVEQLLYRAKASLKKELEKEGISGEDL